MGNRIEFHIRNSRIHSGIHLQFDRADVRCRAQSQRCGKHGARPVRLHPRHQTCQRQIHLRLQEIHHPRISGQCCHPPRGCSPDHDRKHKQNHQTGKCGRRLDHHHRRHRSPHQRFHHMALQQRPEKGPQHQGNLHAHARRHARIRRRDNLRSSNQIHRMEHNRPYNRSRHRSYHPPLDMGHPQGKHPACSRRHTGTV